MTTDYKIRLVRAVTFALFALALLTWAVLKEGH
jgi:hypothetical protein